MTEPASPSPTPFDPERMRRAEREIDRVHVVVLCACAALLATVCVHYVLH